MNISFDESKEKRNEQRFSNLEENRKKELLTIVDCYLDTLPNIVEYPSGDASDYYWINTDSVLKRISKMKIQRDASFHQFLLQSFPKASPEELNKLVMYAHQPDFYPRLSNKSCVGQLYKKPEELSVLDLDILNRNGVSIIDSVFLANCYENYIMVSPDAVKELYANSILPDFTHKGSIRKGKRTCLFLDKKYDRLDYFFALQIIEVEFLNTIRRYKARFVEVDKKSYNLIFNAMLENFKQFELREPTDYELNRMSEISIMVAYTNQIYSLSDHKDKSHLLKDAMSSDVCKKKVNKVSESLKGFMNATEWSEYQQSMLPYVNTALYYSFTYCTYLNKDIEKMFYQDFTQFGTLYFDNRLCTTDLFNRRQIHSLNSQREMEQEGPYVKKR